MKSTLQYCLSLVVLMLAVPTRAQEGSDPEEDRVRFEFTISEEQGGGKAKLIAGDFEYQEGLYVIATGGVDFKYQGLRLQAERARIDIPTDLLTAEGNVILDEGAQRLVGETVQYDLNTRTGRVTDATAYVEGEYYFTGSQIAKTGENTFTVDDGIFTSCNQDVPSWSIHMSAARITLEEYARIKNARLKFKKLPVFYAPYILWPANTERASGLLVPKPGFSSRRGAELSLAYFKTLGRSADTTFHLDLSTDEYFGFGNETRYRPSENTEGFFRAYILDEPVLMPGDEFFNPNPLSDRDPGDARWKLEWQHEAKDLWGGFRGVINFQEYSDLDYLRDYERNADSQRRSFIYSNAFLTRNFGQQSFNIMVDQRERIVGSGSTDIRRQLPEVEYKLRPTKLGRTPMYLSFDSSLHYFSFDLGEGLADEYGRVDFFPTLSVPLSTVPWLSAKVDLSGRGTYYTESLKPEGDPEEGTLGGGSLTRFFPQAGLEIIGPTFSRIFNRKSGAKLKHIIEPRMSYAFVDDFDEQADLLRFDEIDNLRPVNGWLFSLVNRFMSKPAGDGGSAVEVAALTFSQGLSLDDMQPGQQSQVAPELFKTNEGPLAVALRMNPSESTSVKLDLGFSTLFDSYDITSLRLSGSTRLGPHSFRLSWFSNWRVDLENPADLLVPSEDDPEILVPVPIPFEERAVVSDKTSEQIRLSAGLALLPEKLTLQAELSFDVLGRLNDSGGRDAWDLLQQRYFFNWQSQCYSWQLEYRESSYSDIEDRDVRFSLTLKNVGTFLDLNDSF
ncbi:MAG: LPS-assembly protein LptD [bacterium]|nr:LPS-assembly protein LptD [bacterium]